MITNYEKALQAALTYLDYQSRTRREVERRLLRAGYEADDIEAVLHELELAGYVNDERYSSEWVESRGQRHGIGRTRLAQELMRKGVDKETTDQALSELDPETEFTQALELARKRAGVILAPDPAQKRRLAAFLQRRGYNWSIIEQVFSKLFANID